MSCVTIQKHFPLTQYHSVLWWDIPCLFHSHSPSLPSCCKLDASNQKHTTSESARFFPQFIPTSVNLPLLSLCEDVRAWKHEPCSFEVRGSKNDKLRKERSWNGLNGPQFIHARQNPPFMQPPKLEYARLVKTALCNVQPLLIVRYRTNSRCWLWNWGGGFRARFTLKASTVPSYPPLLS